MYQLFSDDEDREHFLGLLATCLGRTDTLYAMPVWRMAAVSVMVDAGEKIVEIRNVTI